MIADELLRDGTIVNNFPKLRAIYRERRDAMLDALEKSIGPNGTWTHPLGGLFIWLTVHGDIDTPSLATEALQRNVAFVPGDSFYFDGRGADSMRLNFSCMPPDRIYEGMRRLGELIAERQGHVTSLASTKGSVSPVARRLVNRFP
jgi:2-aminoadipate transaminase